MTSTPVTILSKRSGNAADRPLTTTVQAGELALNFAGAENGLYFKDSAGAIRKVAGTHYGTNAPNSSPAGETGNSVGEVWVSSSAPYYLQVWTGASWQKVGAAFADVSTQANVTIASGALSANGAILASGALSANGAILASGALSANGAVLASGALSADGAILASGALSANGAVLASGALSANGAVFASGSLSADGAILASGVITATGVPVAGIYTGGFPAVGDIGTLIYRNDAPSGLYISVNGGWALT
jgi:hypothetical protein